MAEEEQKAAEAAAAAAAAAAKAREQLADWEAKQAKLAEVERELETAQQRLELKLQEQAEEVERLKQEQGDLSSNLQAPSIRIVRVLKVSSASCMLYKSSAVHRKPEKLDSQGKGGGPSCCS
eukprot:1158210-Pelagomonas_calceolata.AAC.5